MSRNDGRIEKGQSLRTAISARAWNRAQEAADRVLGAQPGIAGGGATVGGGASNIVYVENASGATVPVGGVLALSNTKGFLLAGGTLAGNNDASRRLKEMFQNPNYFGSLPDASSSIAIALEPIESGKFGRMAIRGSVYFRLRVTNELHKYAAPLKDDVTQLRSAGCGPVRILWKASGLGDAKNAFGIM